MIPMDGELLGITSKDSLPPTLVSSLTNLDVNLAYSSVVICLALATAGGVGASSLITLTLAIEILRSPQCR